MASDLQEAWVDAEIARELDLLTIEDLEDNEPNEEITYTETRNSNQSPIFLPSSFQSYTKVMSHQRDSAVENIPEEDKEEEESIGFHEIDQFESQCRNSSDWDRVMNSHKDNLWNCDGWLSVHQKREEVKLTLDFLEQDLESTHHQIDEEIKQKQVK